MTVWFYGQAPGPRGTPGREAFVGSSFLCGLASAPEYEMRQRIRFVNVLTTYPGPSGGKGDAFPLELARQEADQLMNDWEPGDQVVFAGRRVAEAFGWPGLTWFEWVEIPTLGIEVAGFPHPSGVNLLWNDKQTKQRAAAFMRQLMKEAP